MRRLTMLVLVTVAVLAAVSPAFSDDVAVEDPAGDGSGSVDFIGATHGHGTVESGTAFGVNFGGTVIVHELTSTDEWTFDGDAVEIRMTSRTWKVPRRLFVRSNPDGSLTGVVFTRDYFRGYANVFRPEPTTLRIEFPESVLGTDVRSYRWRAFGTGTSGGCDADCELPPPDRVPDTGTVLHSGLWRYNP